MALRVKRGLLAISSLQGYFSRPSTREVVYGATLCLRKPNVIAQT